MKPSKKETTTNIETPLLDNKAINLTQSLRKKHSLLLLCGLLGLMLIAVVGFFYFRGRTPLPQPYQGGLQKIRVSKIGVNPLLQTIAENKGYFAQNGLELVITNYETGKQTLDALLANKLDIGFGGDFTGVSYMFGQPWLRIIASESQQDSFSLIVKSDKNIVSPSDLKGKKIGVTLKGPGEFYLARFLNTNDLHPQDIQLVDLLPADMSAQLVAGTLDGAVQFEPSAFNLKKELGGTIQAWPIQGAEKISANLYATKDFIATRPDLIERYLRALTQAQEFLAAQPDAAKAIMVTSGNFSQEYVDYFWQKTTYNVSLQQSMILTMEEQARFLINAKATAQTPVPNYLDYIYFDALEKVKPNAISIVH